MTTTRKEHMYWCKQRALDLLNDGYLAGAVASMLSDLRKHAKTDHPGNALMAMVGFQAAATGNEDQVRSCINRFT